jgi:hypothetical protein
MSGTLSLDGEFGLRAELADPAEFERTLAKVADVLPSVAEGAGAGEVELRKPRREGGLYELRQPDEATVYFGVLNDVLVVAEDAGEARRLASERPAAVVGAEGALTLRADAQQLVNDVLGRIIAEPGLGGAFGAQLFTGPLGDLTGSVSAGTDGLRGRLRLDIE